MGVLHMETAQAAWVQMMMDRLSSLEGKVCQLENENATLRKDFDSSVITADAKCLTGEVCWNITEPWAHAERYVADNTFILQKHRTPEQLAAAWRPLTEAEWDTVVISGQGPIVINCDSLRWDLEHQDQVPLDTPCTLRKLLQTLGDFYHQELNLETLNEIARRATDPDSLSGYVQPAIKALHQGETVVRHHLMGGLQHFEGVRPERHYKSYFWRLSLGS